VSDKHRPAFLKANSLEEFVADYEKLQSNKTHHAATHRPTQSGDVHKFILAVMQFESVAPASVQFNLHSYANGRALDFQPCELVQLLRFYGRVSKSDWYFTDAMLRRDIFIAAGNCQFAGLASSPPSSQASNAAITAEEQRLKEEEKQRQKKKIGAPEALDEAQIRAAQLVKRKEQEASQAAAKAARLAASKLHSKPTSKHRK
jgi:hypothetical protein